MLKAFVAAPLVSSLISRAYILPVLGATRRLRPYPVSQWENIVN